MAENIICGKTLEEIEVLKEKHGCLILATVKQGVETYNAIFKEPTYVVLEASRKISQTDEIKATKVLYKSCLVVADQEIADRDYLQVKAVESIGKHMTSFSVEVKNL